MVYLRIYHIQLIAYQVHSFSSVCKALFVAILGNQKPLFVQINFQPHSFSSHSLIPTVGVIGFCYSSESFGLMPVQCPLYFFLSLRCGGFYFTMCLCDSFLFTTQLKSSIVVPEFLQHLSGRQHSPDDAYSFLCLPVIEYIHQPGLE